LAKHDYQELEYWQEYINGTDFKSQIGLYDEVNKNFRFYSGEQWSGVVSNGLPTPVLNLIKRITDHKVNIVMGDDIKINYSIDGIDDTDYAPDKEELRQLARALSAYAMTLEENLNASTKDEQALLDSALSGDGMEFMRWDPSIDAGNGIYGGIDSEIVDNVNYLPGNPNSDDVQTQPSIIIAFRKMVSELQAEAKQNGIPQDEIDKIASDEETDKQAGDNAKIELTKSGKAICLLKMWKKDGKVYFNKSTRYARITKGDIDSGLTLYPVAKMTWSRRKNCCHGTSEVKGLIPNQIAINKLVAMIIMSVMHTAFPKAVYDNTRIASWSNLIGAAIGVTGGDIKQAAGYIQPGQLSNDIYKIVDLLIQLTKEMTGSTDAAMGELNMDNTSALIVLQKAAAIPLKSISRRFYRFKEDKARIYMDFFIHKYRGVEGEPVARTLTYKEQGVNRTFDFDGSKYGDLQWRVKVDVGASTHWSEVTAIQTMTNFLQAKEMTFVEVLERLPNGIIPMREKLMQDRLSQDMDREIMISFLADYVEGLPPEIRAKLQAMKPDEMEAEVKQMVAQDMQQKRQQPQANQAAAAM